MQYRMKNTSIIGETDRRNLKKGTGRYLATINEDGSPYATPIHFVYDNGKIYMHGLPAGQKVDNIRRNGSVSFMVYHMNGLLLDENELPCDTNTAYQSVIISGRASFF
ncbi:MAG: pyridoxamine 5'-phosphate oxidase family protein [Ruminococcus sp.]|nr:MAG: pyridoxamine 5'-phosphate oxidase family protein [Ruminococcus sp.]